MYETQADELPEGKEHTTIDIWKNFQYRKYNFPLNVSLSTLLLYYHQGERLSFPMLIVNLFGLYRLAFPTLTIPYQRYTHATNSKTEIRVCQHNVVQAILRCMS